MFIWPKNCSQNSDALNEFRDFLLSAIYRDFRFLFLLRLILIAMSHAYMFCVRNCFLFAILFMPSAHCRSSCYTRSSSNIGRSPVRQNKTKIWFRSNLLNWKMNGYNLVSAECVFLHYRVHRSRVKRFTCMSGDRRNAVARMFSFSLNFPKIFDDNAATQFSNSNSAVFCFCLFAHLFESSKCGRPTMFGRRTIQIARPTMTSQKIVITL